MGPFAILSKTSKGLCRLKFPDSMRRLFPVFHLSQLKPVVVNKYLGRAQAEPKPVYIDDQEE